MKTNIRIYECACECDGCENEAEYIDPFGNYLCVDCIQSEVETAEYDWDECEVLNNQQ